MTGKLAKIAHQEDRLRSKARKAHSSGKGLHAANRSYLKSYSARYIAVSEAAQERRMGLSKDDVQTIAREMDVWAPCNETVRLQPLLKSHYADCSEGSYRYILSFGLKNQARQILVRNLLQARWDTQPEQYVFGGGREKAIKQVRSAYRKGFRYVFELDVYHCFKSFDRKGIAEYLSLPERVVTNVLSGDELNITLAPQLEKEVGDICLGLDDMPESPLERFAMMDGDWGPARSGLTEGSKASPFAAELLLAWVLKNVPDGAWRIVNYADNFLCLCESENAAFEIRDILQELLHQHPAGPLKAKQFPRVFSPDEAFEFLGYLLFPKSPIGLGVQWSPRAEAKARNLRRSAYKELYAPKMPIKQKKKKLHILEKQHLAIVNGYPSWPERLVFHDLKMSGIRSTVGLDG